MIATKIQLIETPVGNLVATWTNRGLYSFLFQQKPQGGQAADEFVPALKDLGVVSARTAASAEFESRKLVATDRSDGRKRVDVVANPAKHSNNLERFSLELPRRLEKSVARYFKSGSFAWDLDSLDWTAVPTFHRQVLKACAAIQPGYTVTYGELADQCGSPRAARAVGQAMARNRWPLIIPCHRVVGSSGKLTGYSGGDGVSTKAHLLALERGEPN